MGWEYCGAEELKPRKGPLLSRKSRLYLLRPVALDTETRGGWEMWGFSEVCFELIYGGI